MRKVDLMPTCERRKVRLRGVASCRANPARRVWPTKQVGNKRGSICQEFSSRGGLAPVREPRFSQSTSDLGAVSWRSTNSKFLDRPNSFAAGARRTRFGGLSISPKRQAPRSSMRSGEALIPSTPSGRRHLRGPMRPPKPINGIRSGILFCVRAICRTNVVTGCLLDTSRVFELILLLKRSQNHDYLRLFEIPLKG